MSQTQTLNAAKRDKVGSRYAQRLRRSGRLPAIMYGHGSEPTPIHLDMKEAIRHIEHGWKVFNLEMDEGGQQTVLLRDLQFDYLGTNIVHCDFAIVDLDEKVDVNVTVELTGHSKASEAPGVSVIHPHLEIQVRCSVSNIPDEVELDISPLTEDTPLHASDIPLPEGVELISDPTDVIVALSYKAEQEAEGEEVEAIGEGEGPEVISEAKPEDAGGGGEESES
jgi:large subunit ribosomal protein L25